MSGDRAGCPARRVPARAALFSVDEHAEDAEKYQEHKYEAPGKHGDEPNGLRGKIIGRPYRDGLAGFVHGPDGPGKPDDADKALVPRAVAQFPRAGVNRFRVGGKGVFFPGKLPVYPLEGAYIFLLLFPLGGKLPLGGNAPASRGKRQRGKREQSNPERNQTDEGLHFSINGKKADFLEGKGGTVGRAAIDRHNETA